MRSFLAFAAAFAACFSPLLAAPTNVNDAEAVTYLEHFGYYDTNPRSGNLMSQEELSSAVKTFQRFAGLQQTGILDDRTRKMMTKPRCGNPDVAGTEIAARKKRYALHGSKWDKKELTYKLKNYTPDLDQRGTEKAISDAFKVWEKESGLSFKEESTTKKADIEIKFASGAHGDGDPFDGRSKTLAHAFFPQFGGDAHFDEDEPWAKSPDRGVSLFIVAAHEFGHSLGLSHSDVNSALMAPFYNPQYRGLDRDDIQAIRRLYGPPVDKNRPRTTTTRPRTSRPTRPTKRPRTTVRTETPPVGACNGRFDAITMLENGTTYAFKDEYFWRLNDAGMEKGYPKKTREDWGFSAKVDASLSYGAYTDLFTGHHVRRYYNGRLVSGYPKTISQVYKGIPSNLDTTFVWSGNGRIYFVKGDKYWRYNPSLRMADDGYPKPLKVWKGLPERLDAALQWKDRTYFFKNGYYWRFDDEKVEVAQSLKVPYPRRSDEWWLGCTDNTLKLLPGDGEETAMSKEDADDDGNSSSRLSAGAPQIITSSLLLLIVTKLFS